MPQIFFNCQGTGCQRSDDGIAYHQCPMCRVVLCRNCWARFTQQHNPIQDDDPWYKKGWKMVSNAVVRYCPVCEQQTTVHQIFPLAPYSPST